MAKTKSIYVCNSCGASASKWLGQCGDCGAWNSYSEQVDAPTAKSGRFGGFAGALSEVVELSAVQTVGVARWPTGAAELDRVLGGGLVPGSVVLLGGDPGVGKSTLLLQTCCNLATRHHALYVTGEESLEQVSLRSQRLGLQQAPLKLLAETQVERIIATAQQQKPHIMVVDSVQTLYTELLQSAPGGVSQVRESAAQLTRFAKQSGTALFLVGHVTKDGALAGPRVLEHMVDAVLYFEGESDGRYRLVRAVKNRFGAVNELGVFAMTEGGLKEVKNPSAIFLSRASDPVPGSLVTATWEGTRPILVEVQALVDEARGGNPRRVAVGLDGNRLSMLLAVLHRHGGVITYDQDVFLNVVGGVRVLETSADLAQLLAVVSSLRNRILPHDCIAFGEVGLAGELRPVPNGQDRLREAAKHGFKRAIVPKGNAPRGAMEQMEIVAVDKLADALAAIY